MRYFHPLADPPPLPRAPIPGFGGAGPGLGLRVCWGGDGRGVAPCLSFAIVRALSRPPPGSFCPQTGGLGDREVLGSDGVHWKPGGFMGVNWANWELLQAILWCNGETGGDPGGALGKMVEMEWIWGALSGLH